MPDNENQSYYELPAHEDGSTLFFSTNEDGAPAYASGDKIALNVLTKLYTTQADNKDYTFYRKETNNTWVS